MSTSLQCSSCHELLPDGAPEGLCPSCVSALLTTALRSRGAVKRGKWPRRFGRYELLGKLGAGGMGVVYRARQRRLDRVVALKMIRASDFDDEHEIERFRSETQAVARLDHPHIVPVYEVGERRGRHFFSMLLVESGSLMTHLPRLQKDQRKATQIMSSVARAVHYAHRHGILHRDLKPANILLDSQDQPYLSDFGLARKVDEESGLTQTGALVGTPSYMAPEMCAGKHPRGSPAADVYGLGAILYELLTGQPPFVAETPVVTLKQVQEQEPRRPRSINPKVSPDLETICLKCLEKDPQRRYATAEAVALDLDCFLRDEPISVRPIGRAARLYKCARRHPFWTGITACAAAVLITFTIISIQNAITLRSLLAPPNDPPVVVLMDTTAERGKYKNVPSGGTNATVLKDLLFGLGSLYPEPLDSTWHNEKHILEMRPDIVVIHKSAFFHALNADFKFPYPPFPEDENGKKAKQQWDLLYRTADDKLIAFLGLIGTKYPRALFLVYSRGTDGLWPIAENRESWKRKVATRFPQLNGRIETMLIAGGLEDATFDNPDVRATMRTSVQRLLDRLRTSP